MEQSRKFRMVGYGRVSTDEERQLDSLENQVLFFSGYAEAKGYVLVEVYTDAAVKIGLSRKTIAPQGFALI